MKAQDGVGREYDDEQRHTGNLRQDRQHIIGRKQSPQPRVRQHYWNNQDLKNDKQNQTTAILELSLPVFWGS